tara:strand:- start:1339 stop:2310 length:972 start_codon:yes stop_codon:yes gene_type:complete
MNFQKAKKLNRNSFNEKLIHRYLFERYYFSDRGKRNKLLPAQFHKKDINLIVPEEGTLNNYRADLSIYFKGESSPVPVEVKWKTGSFNKDNQVKYLKENKGFLVSFDKQEGLPVESVEINQDDFTVWFSRNASKLVRESISQQVSNSESGTQYWVVYLVGGAFANFHKMLEKYRRAPFWAFKQNRRALRNILDVQRGDKILFVLGKSDNQAMINDPKKDIAIKEWHECIVKEPYFMSLDNESGNFFEGTKDLPINDRKWPHFINFSITDGFVYDEFTLFGKRGEYAKPFADSVNHGGGVPQNLSRREYEALLDIFRAKIPTSS